MSESKRLRLTGKQQAFIDHYLECLNATEAARRAGYQGNDATLAAVGYENLRKPQISVVIEKHWAAHGVTAEEVISRLTEQARVSVEDFIDIIEPGRVMILNLEKAKDQGKLHLIKKLYWTEQGPRLELHDSQRALELIGKTMGLFTDRHEVSVKLEDVLAGLPSDFGDAVREALAGALSKG